jgi:chaperonin GroES
MNTMTVIPLEDRIIVRLADHDSQHVSVEHSPDTVVRGVVIAAGTGRLDSQGQNVPLGIKAGDTILFGRDLGKEMTVGGIQYWIIKADDIVKIEARGTITILRGDKAAPRP